MAFLNWRFGLTQMTTWRIEVAPVPDLSNVATPTKPIITIPITLYGYGNGDDAEEGGPERRRDGREHGEHKRDKANDFREVWSTVIDPADMLVDRADAAMYAAKSLGRNRTWGSPAKGVTYERGRARVDRVGRRDGGADDHPRRPRLHPAGDARGPGENFARCLHRYDEG